jgi:hypothetical protein
MNLKHFLTLIAFVGVLMFLAAPAQADWDPSMPTKYVQLPDLNSLPGAITGMDVNATWRVTQTPPDPQPPFIKVLADDFPCTVTGPITGIHIWGSWLDDRVNPNTHFHLSIHEDVPADLASGTYSYPGKVLWEQDFSPGSYIGKLWGTAQELFYDPNTNSLLGNDTQVWQYNFPIPLDTAFVQQGTAADPKVYWLDVQAAVPGDEVFGWKTSVDHWNDDAVFADTSLPLSMGGVLNGPLSGPPYWLDMHYPTNHPYAGQSIDQAFAITTVPEPGTLALLGGGLVGVFGLVWRKRKYAVATE